LYTETISEPRLGLKVAPPTKIRNNFFKQFFWQPGLHQFDEF
jgi:hypothetical protein